MTRGGRGGWLRSMQALCDGGALGGLGDAELLGAFLGRGEASGAAFEAVVARHAAMVLDVCRAVAGSEADAEDAFQATFLVLACRASSVRDRDALGPWLFGVARRLAARAGADAARRRASERRAAGLRPASSDPPEADDAVAMLMEEVDRLPARYRDAVVLCHLQGLTYEAAASRLGCPLGTLSTRLRRARERLRRNLEGRGVCGAWALARVPDVAVPPALAASAARLASLVAPTLGAGVPASILSLTRGALTTMKIRRFARLSAVMFAVTLAAGAWGWNAVASHDEPPPATEKKPGRYQLTGKVVDEEGRPAAGARIEVAIRDPEKGGRVARSSRSGPDGRYSIDLPPGHFAFGTLISPHGYHGLSLDRNDVQPTVVSDARPMIRQDFRTRRGVPWDFRLAQDGHRDVRWGVQASGSEFDMEFWIAIDGLVRLGLTSIAGKVELTASAVHGPQARPARGSVRWDDGFRPEAARSVTKLEGEPVSYWITDASGRRAVLESSTAGRLVPGIEDGRLVIRVALAEDSDALIPAMDGRVVDHDGRPVEGARVDLVSITEVHSGSSYYLGEVEGHSVASDSRGMFRIAGIPMPAWGEKPGLMTVQLTVRKDGFAALVPDAIPVESLGAKAVPPIVLKPGRRVMGVVLDPGGRPVLGAEVEPKGAVWVRPTWTDAEGRFSIEDVSEEPTWLHAYYGDLLGAAEAPAATHPSRPVEIRLEKR